MATNSGGAITLRLSVAGAAEVKTALAALGPVGRQMGQQIDAAMRQPSAGMKALSAATGEIGGRLESAAASTGPFGAGMLQLGPAGLVAAAGMAAVVEGVKKLADATQAAIDYGAEVAKTAKTVGASSDFIQEFNYAARQSDIDVGAADGALKGLNTTLGLVQSGLARKQMVNAFKAIGFTPEQLKQYHDAGDLFPVLADRISKIGDASERAAIAKRLGIAELLPMLTQGADSFGTLAAKARDLGLVMDATLVVKAEEAKKKLGEISDVMAAKANIQFVQFADTLIAVKTAFLGAEIAGLHMLAALTNTETPIQKLQDDAKALGIMSHDPNLQGRPFDAYTQAQFNALKDDVTTQKKALAAQAKANAAANVKLAGSGVGNTPVPVGGAAKKPVIGGLPTAPIWLQPAGPYGNPSSLTQPQIFSSDLNTKAEPILSDELMKASQAARDKWTKQANKDFSNIHDQLYSSVYGALSAAFQGGATGVLDFFKQRLEERVLEGLSDAITNAFTQSLNTSGGGITGLFAHLFQFLIPGHADGTPSFAGGPHWVGERGKELRWDPPGTAITSHADSMAIIAGRDQASRDASRHFAVIDGGIRGGNPGGGGPARVTVHNYGAPATAKAKSTANGDTIIDLYPMLQKAILSAGSDGTLQRAAKASPPKQVRRG